MRKHGIVPWVILAIVWSPCTASLAATNPPVAKHQSASTLPAVEVVRYDWHDPKRNREVPAKLYLPQTGDGPFPVIIFSHGLGGTREGYEYLGRHWASHGYVSVRLLITFKDGDHMIFSGRGRLLANQKDDQFQKLICASSTAFWDAYLRGDAKAKAWLVKDFKTVLSRDGVFEVKLKSSPTTE